MDDEAIAGALGLESAYGYHVEPPPRPAFVVPVRDRPADAWYPCLEGVRYSGCLGRDCPLQVCWTGRPTPSYVAALRLRFHPSDDEYAPGALCPRCAQVRETTVSVLDQERGLIPLPLLHCGAGRWRHPISTAALARRRIASVEGADPARCPCFEPSTAPRVELEERRLRRNRLVRERRARQAKERCAGGE